MNRNGINAYKKTNMITADPRRLIILCYETVISNIRMARESYILKDYETKAKCIQKAQDIIYELMYALDFERGGEVAKNLYVLYNFLIRHLLEADLKRDIEALNEVVEMTAELKSAWQEIFYRPEDTREEDHTYDTRRERVAISHGVTG
ncbi:MAG: flagellar export chaperone FliS [Syntrophales bacterium LBB04]|nr:flagellar export chaperone FliS [Syntrophales bacterium LBB04]